MLINMGGVHQVLGELQDALSTYQRALAPLRDLDERQLVGITLNNMGSACRALGEYQKALTYYYQAVEVRREMGDQRRLAISFNNIGFTYLDLGEPSKAAQDFHQALHLAPGDAHLATLLSDARKAVKLRNASAAERN